MPDTLQWKPSFSDSLDEHVVEVSESPELSSGPLSVQEVRRVGSGMAVEKVVLRPARDGRLYRIGLMRHGKAPVMVMLNRRRGTRLSMAVLSLSSTVCCC